MEIDNKDISNSIVAGRDVKNSTNAKDSMVVNNSKIISQARKQAFWVSMITGIVSSLIASFIFHLIVN